MFIIGSHKSYKMFCYAIIDREPPYYTYCPADIHKTYSPAAESPERGMQISWRAASFADNSGIHPTVYSSRQIGSYFQIGITAVSE